MKKFQPKSVEFISKEGRHYKARALNTKEGVLVGVNNERYEKEKKLTPREWEVFRDKKNRELKSIEPETLESGDILEMKDRSYLKIKGWDETGGNLEYEYIGPNMRTDKRGIIRSRTKEEWQSYKDEVVSYMPARLHQTSNKPMQDRQVPSQSEKQGSRRITPSIIDQEHPPKRKRRGRMMDDERIKASKTEIKPGKKPDGYEAALAAAAKGEIGPEQPQEGPLKQGRKEWESENLRARDRVIERKSKDKDYVPLGLQEGKSIWTKIGEEVRVVKVVINPETTDSALKEGYVILGFAPKEGRNSEYQEEIVPFHKLERWQENILTTEKLSRAAEVAARAREKEQAAPPPSLPPKPEKIKMEDKPEKKKWWRFWR